MYRITVNSCHNIYLLIVFVHPKGYLAYIFRACLSLYRAIRLKWLCYFEGVFGFQVS